MNKKKWFLIAEDEESFRDYLIDCLDITFDDKIAIVEAEDGLDATKKMSIQAFDCIITDLNMPKREGPEFIRHARQSLLNSDTPIIVITGNPETPLEQPRVAVLPKPLNADVFLTFVKKLLKIKEEKSHLDANLINSLCKVLNSSYKEKYLKDLTQQKPVSMTDMQSLPGELCSLISYKGIEKRHRFAFFYDLSVLNHIVNDTLAVESPQALEVADQITKSIISPSDPGISGPALAEVQVKTTQKDDATLTGLKLVKQIHIPFTSFAGSITMSLLID